MWAHMAAWHGASMWQHDEHDIQVIRITTRQSKHIGFICKYIEKFSMMLLKVPRMDKDDKFHYFTKRLQT
ncbi:unnamed protein product [Spirodela intermedia]|uniref:Uncharacterized protein n=1 Tax=Spirodela intermedia TaxID=51605 RepID=A0A7I8JGU0_SPIIN|nr:unnamed protein product [Spirodela intermedia]CAA6669379.1 unnamed protein product [Spirodela intermedia]